MEMEPFYDLLSIEAGKKKFDYFCLRHLCPSCLPARCSPPVTNFSLSHVFASRLYRYIYMAWHDRNEEYFVYVSVSQYFLSLCWTLVSFADQLRMKQLQLKETYKVYREIQLYQVHISILSIHLKVSSLSTLRWCPIRSDPIPNENSFFRVFWTAWRSWERLVRSHWSWCPPLFRSMTSPSSVQ